MIELNSIIGNIAALTILLFIGLLVFKSKKTRLLYIVWITFGLNVGIFAVGIFTKYYSTMFSIYEMTLFYNPALDLAGSIFVEALREIFVYYRILVFIPTIVLSMSYLVIKSKHKTDKKSFSKKKYIKIWSNATDHGTYYGLYIICIYFRCCQSIDGIKMAN